jgi:hypothetical protein
MKKVILMMLALLVILTCVGITACGGGKEKETTPVLTKTQGQTPTGVAPKPTQASGDAGSWGSIPIYPGSKKIIGLKSDDNETLDDKPAVMEHRTYDTGGKVDDVADFYKDKMPANGWNETMWTELGQAGYMGQYEKNGGQEIVVLGIAENTQTGGTVYNIDWKYVK